MLTKSEAEYFDHYRNELIVLTEKTVQEITELAQDTDFKPYVGRAQDEIKYALSILKRNIFPIALFAKFQSGKSTTTAAMADGREITPCGKGSGGLRTSTVPVTIYNDDNVQEVEINGVRTSPVTINLYSERELTQAIIDAAGGNLEDMNALSYDLTKEKDRKILKAAVEVEIDYYRYDKNYSVSRLSLLRDAILILAFYDSNAHKRLRAGEYSTIAGMQPFLKTDNWELKWTNLRKEGFDIVLNKHGHSTLDFRAEENLHVFVDNIVVPVKSEFMAKTGTAVTDAPGTMANLKDTQRAIRAASEAAIIVFVIDGRTEFSEDDRNQLKFLRESGLADKVFFVINFRDMTPEIIQTNGIQKSITAVLKQEGYIAPHHEKFLYYNAYLAMHAFQGANILHETIDDLSKDGLLRDADAFHKTYATLEEAWMKTTMRPLRSLDNDDLADDIGTKGLTDGTVAAVRSFSRWDTMIFSLRAHVLKNRAAGLLRDLGARPIVKTLESIERILKQREDTAESDEAVAKRDYEEAKAVLEKFSLRAGKVIDENFTTNIDDALAEDYYNEVLLGSVKETASIAAPPIYNSTGVLSNVSNMGGKLANFVRGKKHMGIEERCNNFLSDAYKYIVFRNSADWSDRLEQREVYNHNVKRIVLGTQRELRLIWKELQLGDNEMLNALEPIPQELSGSMSQDVHLSDTKIISLDPTLSATFDVMNMIKAMLASTATIYGAAYIYINVLPATFIIPFFGQILGIVAGIVGALVWIFSDAEEEDKIRDLEGNIAKELRNYIIENKATLTAGIAKGQPSEPGQKKVLGMKSVREFYAGLFKGKIELQRKALDDAYKQKLAELALSKERRAVIKDKAEEWRTKHITPLRKSLAMLERDIEDVWGGGETANA